MRKSSLQMPPPVESLIQTSLSHYNALSTQQGVDALGIVNSPTSAAVAAAAAKQQSNSSISSSSVNWQSYFNTKISKDKLTVRLNIQYNLIFHHFKSTLIQLWNNIIMSESYSNLNWTKNFEINYWISVKYIS